MEKKTNERSVRIERLEKIRSRGIPPYPSSSARTHTIQAVLGGFDHLSESANMVTVAGRIMGLREHGGSAFIDMEDGTGRMQAYLKKDVVSKPEHKDKNPLLYEDFLELIDIGDFVEITGTVFTTKAGEKTVLVLAWRLTAKAIRPIPSRWYGIQDAETRYRKRYLDFLLNPPLKEMFTRKARFWNSMREFLIARDFLEVYTPVLETTAGGADAEPFVTHYNALGMDVYLRISTGELWQKRLMVAGFPKTFEIGRQFRNEGIDHEHLQDYTQMECYMA
ncbi:MAG: lysine--tRNA ligase, partial [Candidatus Jacksonbacteria bacterium]|nr:lysine--tRNA ligase [Candidatus Jacksonbacteria bacterium]